MLPLGRSAGLTGPDRASAAFWLDRLPDIVRRACAIADVEGSLSVLTDAARSLLGDRSAAGIKGALKPGERDYRVSGVFLIAPDRRHNVLVANQGFPPEQRRLSIPITWNHPGRVVETERTLLLENTDDHQDFRQFLKTSRMGSSLYAPIFTGSGMIGQIVVAAQARWTYSPEDIPPLLNLAAAAALVWESKGGTEWWEADHPADDAWYAEEMTG